MSSNNKTNNLLVFLSGAPGVGKSTIARALLSQCNHFLVVEEADLIREVLRGDTFYIIQSVLEYLEKNGYLKSRISISDYKSIISRSLIDHSTSMLSYEQYLQQCEFLLSSIQRVCERLRDKKIPAIIEGVNLPINALTSMKLDWSKYNVFYFNLFIKDDADHRLRISQREKQREDMTPMSEDQFMNIRTLNRNLNEDTNIFIQQSNKLCQFLHVSNLDVSTHKNVSLEESISEAIGEIIKKMEIALID